MQPSSSLSNYLPSPLQKVSRVLTEKGLRRTLAAAAHKPGNYFRLKIGASFDRALGLDTVFSAEEEAEFPAAMPETQQGYDPVGVDTFREMMKMLPIRFEEFSFIDLGSGKGRALILACEFGFQKMVGVEYSPHYHEIAVRNLDTYRKHVKHVPPIELVQGDATTFDLPNGKSVVFLFNPFQGPAFSGLVTNLEHALKATTDEIYVAYVNPVCKEQLDPASGFRLLHHKKHRDPYRTFAIYHGGGAGQTVA